MVGQAAPLGGNRGGVRKLPSDSQNAGRRRQFLRLSLILAVYNECSWEGEAPQKTRDDERI